MDIHAPEHPIHSWREFAIHIAVVTVGILIAIGLEGVREAFVTHHLLRETRENFREDLTVSLENMGRELPRVQQGDRALQTLVAQMPALATQHPEQVISTLATVNNPNYFFSTNAWQSALSTGALAHMHPDEVTAYAWAAEGTRIYTEWQNKTLDAATQAKAFWQSHPHPSPAEIEQGDDLLRLLASDEATLANLAKQQQAGLERAQRAAE